MSQADYVSLTALLSALDRYCRELSTGVLHVVTQENHSASFHLKTGQIVALRYRISRGMRAIPALRAIQSASYRFEPKPDPAADSEPLPSTAEIMTSLGWSGVPANSQASRRAASSGAQLSNSVKTQLQTLLSDYLGPVSSLIAQQVFATTDDTDEAVRLLAAEIPDATRSAQFLQQVRQELN